MKSTLLKIGEMADRSGLTYLWLGAKLQSDTEEWKQAGWITGEDWTFDNWYPGEPSRQDADGTKELFLCMWKAKYNEEEIGWTFNDQRNDIVGAFPKIAGKVGMSASMKEKQTDEEEKQKKDDFWDRWNFVYGRCGDWNHWCPGKR